MPTTKATSRALWLTLGAAFLGWMLDGVEQGIFPLIARPAVQEMLGVHGDQQVGIWIGWLTACFLIGAAGGGVAFGWLGDKIGRVKAMSYSILVYSVFTGLCYFATEPWHLAAFRLISALGMGGQWSLGVALVMETWPSHHRPWLAGVIGASANVGFLLIGVIAFYFPVTGTSWRWIMVLGAAPAVLTLLIRLYVPESERWQSSITGVKSRPLREIFAPGVRGKLLIGIIVSSIPLIGTWGSLQWAPPWADKMTGGKIPEAKAVTAIVLALGAITGCSIVGWFCGRFKRRITYCALCLLTYLTCWIFFHMTAYGTPFLVMAYLAGAISGTYYGWLPLYLPELFPSRIRATAQGVSYNAGRIVAAVGAVSAGQLVSFYDGSYARMGLAITVIYLVGAIVIWFAPETKHEGLPA